MDCDGRHKKMDTDKWHLVKMEKKKKGKRKNLGNICSDHGAKLICQM